MECGALLPEDESVLCVECEDDAIADAHGMLYDDCACDSCRAVHQRERADELRREAQHAGGISSFGREVLGWVHDE
jgi:hypothetical protein